MLRLHYFIGLLARRVSKRNNALILVLLDVFIIINALSFAHVLAGLEWPQPPRFMAAITVGFITLKISFFWGFGLYKLMWRYAKRSDFFAVINACIAGSIVCTLLLPFMLYKQNTLFDSLRLLGIDAGLTFTGIIGLRAMLKFYRDYLIECNPKAPKTSQKRVFIIGAGEAGNMIANELSRNPHSHRNLIGFIDDNEKLLGRKIHGVHVLGTRKTLETLIISHKIEELIIAIPSAPGSALRDFVKIANACHIDCQTTPKLSDLIQGKIQINQIRKINIQDLLGRKQISLSPIQDRSYLTGKTILVTGAGGSIGSELCRQIIQANPKNILLLDHSENAIYHIDQALRMGGPDSTSIYPLIRDVKNKDSLERVFQTYTPDIIFHAAAHKHVPLMEVNITEAIDNNILGTQNLIALADRYKTHQFILISSDKAVHPSNCMGATKRACELLVQAYAKKSDTIFSSVRFGNVLGSNGSVIPLFKKQIQAGGPITITHPDITRYFMTISEAVSLVLQTGSFSQNGALYILDMGEPIKITQLAEDLIHLSGMTKEDIKIRFIGLRPGEKLYEELFYDPASTLKTTHKKIFLSHGSPSAQDYLTDIDTLLTQNKTNAPEHMKEQLFSLITKSTPLLTA